MEEDASLPPELETLPDDRVLRIAAGHFSMVTAPDALGAVLLPARGV